MADAVVAGGGIMGASAALHLARAGVGHVVLVEREPTLGTQTTAAGAGFVGIWAGELEAELATYGIRFYLDVQERSGADLGVRNTGLLFPAVSPEGVEMLRQEYHRELEFAPGVRMLSAAETVELAPILAADAVHGGLLQPDAIQVDTVRVIGALAGELAAAGVEVRTGAEVRTAITEDGRVTAVETSEGTIPARVFVNAAGAGARALGARNGIDIAAVPLLESRFTTAPIEGVDRRLPMMLFFERDLLYLREHAGGLLIGAIEQTIEDHSRVSLDDPPRTRDLPPDAVDGHERLARSMAGIIPALAGAEVNAKASGLPTWTPDGRHIVGPVPGIEGYLVLAGCNESGVTDGPGLARIVAEIAATGRSTQDISAYRVERFGELAAADAQHGAERQYLLRHPPEPGMAATPFGIEIDT